MPVNPHKRQCQTPGCRAWAVRGTEPPLCSAHAGRNQGAGAPLGNQNNLRHSFYARALPSDERRDLGTDPQTLDLDAEIAIVRVAQRRILSMLLAGTTLGADPLTLSTAELVRLFALAFQGARTIARLLAAQQKLAASGPSAYDDFVNRTLDALSADWNVAL